MRGLGRVTYLGFVCMTALTLLVGGIAVYSLSRVTAEKDRVIAGFGESLVVAANLQALSERTIAANRGYLLTKDPTHLETVQRATEDYERDLATLNSNPLTEAEAAALEKVAAARKSYLRSIDEALDFRRTDQPMERLAEHFAKHAVPDARIYRQAIGEYIGLVERELALAQSAAERSASSTRIALGVVTAVGVMIAIVLGIALSRWLSQRIGFAIQGARRSWNEIQSLAYQQSHDARKQAATIQEIDLTVKELIETARELAETAQQIESGPNSLSGNSLSSTRQEVAVQRKLAAIGSKTAYLDTKAKQIGGLLQATNELAEQTNSLAFKASLKAAEDRVHRYPFTMLLFVRILSAAMGTRRTAEE